VKHPCFFLPSEACFSLFRHNIINIAVSQALRDNFAARVHAPIGKGGIHREKSGCEYFRILIRFLNIIGGDRRSRPTPNLKIEAATFGGVALRGSRGVFHCGELTHKTSLCVPPIIIPVCRGAVPAPDNARISAGRGGGRPYGFRATARVAPTGWVLRRACLKFIYEQDSR
jgi:hypothetical protein